MDTLKQKKIKINNIHCERGFLYILGDLCPWCGTATGGGGTGQQPPFCIQTLFKGLCLNRA